MLLGSLAALAAVAAFFLIRPFLGPLPAYGPRPAGTTYSYNFVVVGAFLPYAAAVWVARQGVSLRTALAGAGTLSALLLVAAPTQSQDVFMYLFYGREWAIHGANPYVALPLSFASDPWFPWVRWPDQVSVYGPLWTLAGGAIAWASGGSLGAALAIAKVLTAAGIVAMLAGVVITSRDREGDPAFALVLFGWNPLVLVSVALGAHTEGAVAALVLWGMISDRRGRTVMAMSLLVAAALIKLSAALFPLVYLAALWRRRSGVVGPALAAVALAVAAFAPFWVGLDTLAGVFGFVGRATTSLAGGVEDLLATLVPSQIAVWAVRLVALALLGVALARSVTRPSFPRDPWPGAAAVFATFLLVTPWLLYWYVVPLLALAAVVTSPALRAGSYVAGGTSLLTISGGGGPWGTAIQTAVRYGAPLATFAVARRRGSALGSPRG